MNRGAGSVWGRRSIGWREPPQISSARSSACRGDTLTAGVNGVFGMQVIASDWLERAVTHTIRLSHSTATHAAVPGAAATSARGRPLHALAAASLSLLVLTGCVTTRPHETDHDVPSEGGMPVPENFSITGIDIAYHQGTIDWAKVKGAGYRFAWVKATEGGDWKDPTFGDNWNNAAIAGIPRGAYHVWYFCRPVQEQIDWYIRHVPKDPSALPPALDMEWMPHSRICPNKPPRDKLLADMRIWLEAIERHYGKRPVIYTTVDFHKEAMHDAFHDYHIWVRSVRWSPWVKYGARRWHFWQYTGTGNVEGIKRRADKNVFFGSEGEWKRFLDGALPVTEGHTPQPPKEEGKPVAAAEPAPAA